MNQVEARAISECAAGLVAVRQKRGRELVKERIEMGAVAVRDDFDVIGCAKLTVDAAGKRCVVRGRGEDNASLYQGAADRHHVERRFDLSAGLDDAARQQWARQLAPALLPAEGASLLLMAAAMNDPLIRFGPLGALTGDSRILYDSLVAANEAMVDSASANLGFERMGCLSNRATEMFGSDSVLRIGSAAQRAVREEHTRAELEAGQKGIAMLQQYADEQSCLRVDSLWHARAAALRKTRK